MMLHHKLVQSDHDFGQSPHCCSKTRVIRAVSIIEHGEVSEGGVVDYCAANFGMELSVIEDAEYACHGGRESEVVKVVLGHGELVDVWLLVKWVEGWLLWFYSW